MQNSESPAATVTIREESRDDRTVGEPFDAAAPEWENAANLVSVAMYLEDARKIVESMHRAAGLGDTPFQIVGFAGGSVTPL